MSAFRGSRPRRAPRTAGSSSRGSTHSGSSGPGRQRRTAVLAVAAPDGAVGAALRRRPTADGPARTAPGHRRRWGRSPWGRRSCHCGRSPVRPVTLRRRSPLTGQRGPAAGRPVDGRSCHCGGHPAGGHPADDGPDHCGGRRRTVTLRTAVLPLRTVRRSDGHPADDGPATAAGRRGVGPVPLRTAVLPLRTVAAADGHPAGRRSCQLPATGPWGGRRCGRSPCGRSPWGGGPASCPLRAVTLGAVTMRTAVLPAAAPAGRSPLRTVALRAVTAADGGPASCGRSPAAAGRCDGRPVAADGRPADDGPATADDRPAGGHPGTTVLPLPPLGAVAAADGRPGDAGPATTRRRTAATPAAGDHPGAGVLPGGALPAGPARRRTARLTRRAFRHGTECSCARHAGAPGRAHLRDGGRGRTRAVAPARRAASAAEAGGLSRGCGRPGNRDFRALHRNRVVDLS